MSNKGIIPGKKMHIKKCAYCDKIFYPETKRALFCSYSCRQKFHLLKKEHMKNSYTGDDPNEGEKLPPGTIPSLEMPESKLVFCGDLQSLYLKLKNYLSDDQLMGKKQPIERLKPFITKRDWSKTSIQIYTDDNLMEVFRLYPTIYKLYVEPWECGIYFS